MDHVCDGKTIHQKLVVGEVDREVHGITLLDQALQRLDEIDETCQPIFNPLVSLVLLCVISLRQSLITLL